jgi:hypothetical protein
MCDSSEQISPASVDTSVDGFNLLLVVVTEEVGGCSSLKIKSEGASLITLALQGSNFEGSQAAWTHRLCMDSASPSKWAVSLST